MTTKPIRARLVTTVAVCGALLGAMLIVAPLVGSTHISLTRAFDSSIPFADNTDAQIFFISRLPRVVAAAIVGGALAASGVVFQALLRNPLASPDTLGVSSGAALGAMLAITFDFNFTIAGLPSIPLASFAGSLGALGIVYLLATARRRGLSSTVLLLAGVTMTAFFSALIMFAQYLADFTDTARTVRWLMGMLDVGGYASIVAVLPILAVAFALLATLPRSLDLISLRRRRRYLARRERRAGRAPGARQRLAGHRSRGVDQRAGRVCGHCRPPSRAPVRRLGPSAGRAGGDARWRGVSHRVRSRGADVLYAD